jgi:S1-C subfamily serine protease
MASSRYAFAVAILVVLGIILGNSPVKHSWVETIKDMKRSVVPVVCGYTDNKGKWIVADIEGTGFFVDRRGGRFVTASHVLDGLDTFKRQTPEHACEAAIYVPDEGWEKGGKVINFEYFTFNKCIRSDSADVAVCTLIENPFTSPRLAKNLIQEVSFAAGEVPDGTAAAFTAFPLERTTPITSIGSVAGRHTLDDNDPWFFYLLDKTAWPGASGSPVYTEGGKVIGMIVRTGTDDSAGIGFARCSAAILDLLSRK